MTSDEAASHSAETPTNDGGGNKVDFIYPDIGHPYYIVSPPFTRMSAGVRALHLLCHSLNKRGQAARMIIYPTTPWCEDDVCADLTTPLLTTAAMKAHFERGLAPIMVYPELYSGNPFESPCVVRYALNFPGLLAGDKEFAPEELCFSYSRNIAAKTHCPDNVLYMPTVDTRIFHVPAIEGQRQGSCFYASKYQAAHKGELFECTKNSIEITRDLPNSPSAEEIANLFRRSELFYTYENTALATEAVLCGCPAVFLPNEYLTEIIGGEKDRPYGFAWGTDPEEIAHAKATVHLAANDYLNSLAIYWRELDRFIALTQQHAAGKTYQRPIRVPSGCSIDYVGLRLGYEVIHDIAREVWFERQRWGLPYKIGKWIASRKVVRNRLNKRHLDGG